LSGAVILLDHGDAGQGAPEFIEIHPQMPQRRHQATFFAMDCATINGLFSHYFSILRTQTPSARRCRMRGLRSQGRASRRSRETLTFINIGSLRGGIGGRRKREVATAETRGMGRVACAVIPVRAYCAIKHVTHAPI
jgi:hypothetical protein